MSRAGGSLVAAIMVVALAGCSVEQLDSVLGPAYAEEPEAPLNAALVCAPLARLPEGQPIAGQGLSDYRLAAVEDAAAGRTVNREDLEARYDRLLASVETYAAAFEAADAAIEGDRPQPVNVAATDWRAFHETLSEQREATATVLDVLVDRQSGGTTSTEYREAALEWADAQRGAGVVGSQIPWSHHRAVVYLSGVCGPLPDYDLTETGQ